MWVLRRTDINPPGSFPYEQTEGLQHKFEAQSEIETQAHIVAEFRQANGLPRATVAEAAYDIDVYTCLRLGSNPRFCRDENKQAYVAPNKVRPRTGGGCSGCGARL